MSTINPAGRRHRDHPARSTGDTPSPAWWLVLWQWAALRLAVAVGRRRPVRRRQGGSRRHILLQSVLERGHRLLFFPKPLEHVFQRDTAASRRKLMLACAVIGISSFWILSSFDDEMLPDVGALRQPVRVLIMMLMVGSMVAIFMIPRALRRSWHYEALTLFNTVVLNGSIVWVGMNSSSLLAMTHTQSIVLVIMYAALAARQRFWWTLASTLLTVAAYALLIEGKAPDLQQIVDQNLKLIVVAFSYTLVSNYLFEYTERRAWLLRQLDACEREALIDTRDRLKLLSHCDALTGLFNRRRFTEELEAAWHHDAQPPQPMAVLMIDVDHFKLYNDSYGHPAGDACLVRIANLLRQQVPADQGMVARLGGEEFAVVLRHCPADRARELGQRLCDAVHGAAMAHRASPMGCRVSISVGVAVALNRTGSATDLLAAADRALYMAKTKGRNGVQVAPMPTPERCAAMPALPAGACARLAHTPASPPATPSQGQDEREGGDLDRLLERSQADGRFPPVIEAMYESHQAASRRKHLFLMAWLGIFCINAYVFHSRGMFPDVPEHLLWGAAKVSLALLLLTPVLLCPLQGWLRETLYTEGICVMAVTATYVMSHSTQTSTLSYLTSLLFLPLFAGVVGRQSVGYTATTTAVTLGAALFFIQPTDEVQALVLRDTLIIVAAASLYTMIASVNLDRGARRQWLLGEIERLRQAELEEASRALHELSMMDALTGLPNRRRFEAECARLWAHGGADGAGIALLLVDIDHFKRFNDGYGHPAGDRCLQTVARVLSDVARDAGGFASRLGGEEFAIVLPGATMSAGARVGAAVCAAVRAASIQHLFSSTDTRLTVSAGLACSSTDLHSMARLLTAADHALYQAKRTGRDRLAVHDPKDCASDWAELEPIPNPG